MAYNAVAQKEVDDALSDDDSPSASPVPQHLPPPPFHLQQLEFDTSSFGTGGLFMEHEPISSTTASLGNTVKSMVLKPEIQSYEMLEDDDYTQLSREASPRPSRLDQKVPVHVVDEQSLQQSHDPATAATESNKISPPGARLTATKPFVRTGSGRRVDLRHPTPDLQSLQGAHMANVKHLEKTAEKLSMTSSIEDAIRQMHNEQKRSDSRRSSLLPSPIDMPAVARQLSNPNSILDVNSTARSGGFSPGGFNVISPHNSISGSNRGRSGSKGSRFGARPEPELEGRPLESFVNRNVSSPRMSRSASIAEEANNPVKIALPVAQPVRQITMQVPPKPIEHLDRPATSASANTFDQAQKLFKDFDGEHYRPLSRDGLDTKPAEVKAAPEKKPVGAAHRMSSANRLSTALPSSYADPNTGQQMVYYPAPVPMMLNLPPKLSKAPSPMAREKRRTQVLSSLPPAARKSAIWLPDVLEGIGDFDLDKDDNTQNQEYEPQHQRRSMGGRRSTKDLEHLPPQLRASTFFEPEGLKQAVEVKGESAVATLDSILDAAAFAPVSAFTDHAFAGRLGAEVYGAINHHPIRPKSHIPVMAEPIKSVQKRKSFSNLLFKPGSSEMLNQQQRRSTMSATLAHVNFPEAGEPADHINDGEADAVRDEEELGDFDENEGHPDDMVYEGAPTTLLAELQLRKQQQKHRTRPITAAYPNGMHSTLLEMDAVAQVEKKTRNQKRVNLAWEDPDIIRQEDSGDDDDEVPLAMLYASKSGAYQDPMRPLGLMEKRELEDNEPLSHRRDRLLGKPRPIVRPSTMIAPPAPLPEDDGETLAQRMQRLQGEGEAATTGLPHTRHVSGDFTSELMSQFGGDVMDDLKDSKGKGKETEVPPPEEEETLGQRRKRLQAEREAREKEVGGGFNPIDERPALKPKLSMADILQAHPAASASRSTAYDLKSKPSHGLLGLNDRRQAQRSSTLPRLPSQQPLVGGIPNGIYSASQAPQQPLAPLAGYGTGLYNNHYAPGYRSQAMNMGHYAEQQMMTPMAMPFTNPYLAMGYGGMNMGYQNPMAATMLQMQQMGQQLNQGQIDMVERWRQSVMQ